MKTAGIEPATFWLVAYSFTVPSWSVITLPSFCVLPLAAETFGTAVSYMDTVPCPDHSWWMCTGDRITPGRRKPEYLEKRLFHCHLVVHKCYTNCSGTEPRSWWPKTRPLTPCFEARRFSPTTEHFRNVDRPRIDHLTLHEMNVAIYVCRGKLKCDGTRTETRFRLSAKRGSPLNQRGTSVQSRCAHQR